MLAPFNTASAPDPVVGSEQPDSNHDVDGERVATDAELQAVVTPVQVAIVTPVAVVTPIEVAAAAIDARRAAVTVSLAPDELDDEWFGSFDETKPVDDSEDFDNQTTSTWQRISDWLLRRAA